MKLTQTKAKDRLDIIAELLPKQDGKCPLCGRDLFAILPRNRCIDHCHKTGRIRAVLCRNCNGIEAKIRNLVKRVGGNTDPEEYFKKLIDFWTWHEQNPSKLVHWNYKKGTGKKHARRTKRKS